MSQPRILVIDDDPMIRGLITAMLRSNYLVTVASDGAEGIQKAHLFTPQLFIIDVIMPVWDGLYALRAIRSTPCLAQIPALMLTTDANRQTVIAAVQAGANDYLLKKALSSDVLSKRVEKLLKLGGVWHPSPEAAVDLNDQALGVAVKSVSGEPAGSLDDCRSENAGIESADIGERAALRSIVENWE